MRDRFSAACQLGRDWRSVTEACLDELGEVSPEANLGFVYASEPLNGSLDEVVTLLRKATGVRDWVGTGAAGICANGREALGEGGLALLLAAVPAGSHRLFDGLDAAPDFARGRDHAAAMLGVIHADPRQYGIAEAVEQLAAGADAFLVGGLASAQGAPVQMAGRPTEGGLSGVWLSGEVPVATALTQGCVPIGPVHEITSSQGPWVARLDGRPALDVLKDEIGDILARQLDRLGGYIHAALPLRGLDQADYLVRNLHGIDQRNGALAIGAELRRGDPLLFVKRDVDAARADLGRMLAGLSRNLQGRPVRGALYHSCLARGPSLFGPGNVELGLIQDALGPVPLAGFFANGEIFRDRLYAYTGVLTLFL
jgi:small ligand-binding sensory domain FIST